MFDKMNIRPMLLKEVDKPFDDDNFIYELKFDGIRALIYVSDDEINIISRNGINITKLYPELEEIKSLVGHHKVIFDGEIVTMVEGKASFRKLQERSHLKDLNKIKLKSKEIPITFVVFDILYLDKEIIDLGLMKRKELLNKYPDTFYFVKSKYFYKGTLLFKKVKKLGLEGIVAKEKNSKYIPNKRVDTWIKIKNFKKEEFLVLGYIFNNEKYSLYLGEYKNKELIFIGKVSIGKNNFLMKDILKVKKKKNKVLNINEDITYIEPKKKILVHYMERTKDGRLRQPFIK